MKVKYKPNGSIDYSMKCIIGPSAVCVYAVGVFPLKHECLCMQKWICGDDVQQGQGFHVDPLDQAFLQVPGVQLVLFFRLGPLHLLHPVSGKTDTSDWKKLDLAKKKAFLKLSLLKVASANSRFDCKTKSFYSKK